MGDSKRIAALKDLMADLGLISQANGYATDVASVTDQFVDWETGPHDFPLPVIGVVPGEATYEYISARVLRIRQAVSIEFVYRATTQPETWSIGDALVDDIIAAISVDRTRGGNAMDTRVTSAETDSGNADVMDSRGGTAAGLMRVTIDLHRGLGVS